MLVGGVASDTPAVPQRENALVQQKLQYSAQVGQHATCTAKASKPSAVPAQNP